MNSIKKDLYYKIMKLLPPIVHKKLIETNNEYISDYDFEKSINLKNELIIWSLIIYSKRLLTIICIKDKILDYTIEYTTVVFNILLIYNC